MWRLLADENFDARVLKGVLAQKPGLDFVRVQDVGLAGEDDPVILEWAATEGRVVVTRDAATMIAFAFERIADNLPMPGVLVMRRRLPVGSAIQELLIVIECSEQQEMDGRVEFVPANPIVKE